MLFKSQPNYNFWVESCNAFNPRKKSSERLFVEGKQFLQWKEKRKVIA